MDAPGGHALACTRTVVMQGENPGKGLDACLVMPSAQMGRWSPKQYRPTCKQLTAAA